MTTAINNPEPKNPIAWYQNPSPTSTLHGQLLYRDIDKFLEDFDSGAMNDKLQFLLNEWMANDENYIDRLELANCVYMVTHLMSFLSKIDTTWSTLKYLTLRDCKDKIGTDL